MKRVFLANRAVPDESGLSLVELLVAATLLVIVTTIGFIVTTSLVKGTSDTQRSGALTGSAQTGIRTLSDLFAGAVPNLPVSTPYQSYLFTPQCNGNTASPWTNIVSFPSGNGPFVGTPSSTAVTLCSVRSGSATPTTNAVSYSYRIYLTNCTNGICTLNVDQLPSFSTGVPLKTVEMIPNVCGPSCAEFSGTPLFSFSPTISPSSPPSNVQVVTITLTIVSPTANNSTTVSSQVLMLNAAGGLL
jgi:hypothetical protein